MEQEDHTVFVDERGNLYNNYRYQHKGSQKLGYQSTSRPTFIILGYISRGSLSYNKVTCSNIFIAALVIIARNWMQIRSPSRGE